MYYKIVLFYQSYLYAINKQYQSCLARQYQFITIQGISPGFTHCIDNIFWSNEDVQILFFL